MLLDCLLVHLKVFLSFFLNDTEVFLEVRDKVVDGGSTSWGLEPGD